MRAGNRVRALSGLAAVGARALARPGLELARIRLRQARVRRELKAGLAPLGDAVRQGDQGRADALKRSATEMEHELGQLEREASAAVAAARGAFAREQATLEPTRRLPPTRGATGSVSRGSRG